MASADPPAVIAELDRLLDPYGGLGAIGRRHQPSHWFIENELRELRTMASILPVIFLVVAAFLLNIVLSRMIAVQRTQIAALRALGYPELRDRRSCEARLLIDFNSPGRFRSMPDQS